MNPTTLDAMLHRVGRSLRWTRLAKVGLVAAGFAGAFGLIALVWPGADEQADMIVLLAAVGTWSGLSLAAGKSIRLLHAAAVYQAMGRADLAEQSYAKAAEDFSFLPNTRLAALRNLAVLAHNTGRFAQAIQIGTFLLGRTGRYARSLRRRCHLLLADSELMLGNLDGCHEHLSALQGQTLALWEQLALLPITCYYEVACGAWERLAEAAGARQRLARLLAPNEASKTLACMALGCMQLNRQSQCDWLWARATLLADPEELLDRYPLLAELASMPVAQLPWEQTFGEEDRTA